MFASSQYPLQAAPPRCRTHSGMPVGDEGRECEACRRVTAALLLPQGRPGGWLLLLAASCACVLLAQLLG